MTFSKKGIIVTLTTITLCGVAVFFFLRPGSNTDQQVNLKSADTTASSVSENFSFLELNADSILTDDVKRTVNDKLGPDAYETKTTVDLELHAKGFLADYFPELDALNRRLNPYPGERVEHDTIQLTFRYARNNNTPFEFVRMMFSRGTKKPLFFKIQTTREGVGEIDTIQAKYGPPVVREWTDGKGKSYLWEKQGDVLLISETQSRIGTPRYHIGFFFIDNINALLEKERASRLNDPKTVEKTGQTAF